MPLDLGVLPFLGYHCFPPGRSHLLSDCSGQEYQLDSSGRRYSQPVWHLGSDQGRNSKIGEDAECIYLVAGCIFLGIGI